MRDAEQVIAGLKEETIREMTKEGARPEAQLAWYWTYIGSLDMAQQLGLINDARRQHLYREMDQFKPAHKVVAALEAKPNPLAATEMSVEQNYNQIDGVINNETPRTDELASEDEALFLVNGTTYLHVQTSEDDRDYSRDDCYTTYDYTLYDKETMRQLDGGRMEVVADIRDKPWQIHRLAAQNILECMTDLGTSDLKPVSIELLEELQSAAAQEAEERVAASTTHKPSLLENLRQCRKEAEKSQVTAVPPSRDPVR